MQDPDPVLDEDLAPVVAPPSRSIRVRIGVGGGIVLLLTALIVAVLVSSFSPRGGTEEIDAASDPPAGGATLEKPEDSSGTSVIFVHIFGAVENPGLFELAAGSRVIDVVSAAGGFTADAEPSAVNLARPLSDGEQLAVLRVGEAPSSSDAGASESPAPGGLSGGSKVNINTGGSTELITLPQVGPATAQRIVDWRAANGRFSSLEDLMSVSGIGQKTYDALKDLITL